jgi:hypothetical protein
MCVFKRQGYLGIFVWAAIWGRGEPLYAQPLPAQAGTPVPVSTAWLISTMVLLLLITGGFLGYMYVLQRRFFEACKTEKQMALFFQSPAGLPVGTVRSVLALLIVTVSLYFIVLQAFRGLPFPDALTALIGAVIGFYFGGRTAASKGEDEALREQVTQVQAERDQAVVEKDAGQAGALLKKVQKGIALSKAAAAILPANARGKYDETLTRLEQGVGIVEGLSKGGNVAEAVKKAGELFELFKTANPVRDLVEKATRSFGRVLGSAVPSVGVIRGIVGVSTRLVGVAYQKWKARILRLPFSPAVIPLEVVDANTGFVLFLRSPIFKDAFAKELEGNDRPFVETAVREFLREENLETLWARHKDRFESREQFESGVEEFRRAAADAELKRAVDPALLAEVGGYEPLMAALDRVSADPEAGADLDALVTVAEGLGRKDEPVKAIFDKVLEEVSK